MPYIAIKSFPKDMETKKKMVEKINEAFLEIWGCPQEAITISMEEFQPNDWKEKVVKAQIDPIADKLMMKDGKKCYK